MSELDRLLENLAEPDAAAAAAVRSRAARVLRPAGALDRLDEIAAWLAGWQRTPVPSAERPHTIVFVADHGVAEDGVSAYPAGVTAAMLYALRDGVATAAAMTRALDGTLEIVDVGVGRPTGNLRREPALTPERFEECVAAGRQAVEAASAAGAGLLVLGEMGIGNTTAAAAVCACLFGGPAEAWCGLGTGVDEAGRARKVAVVEAARARIDGAAPLEVLREVGGSELVAIAAALAEARRRSIPVLLDGFVVTAAAAAIDAARPGALGHCLAAHCSGEAGHRPLLEKLGLEPLLDLGLRLGEGSGALAAVPLVRLAIACVNDVATFDDLGLVP